MWRYSKNQEDNLITGGSESKRKFTYAELVVATNNFALLLGQGGFGRVYKGRLRDTNQLLKKLSNLGLQGESEFLTESHMLTFLRHPNVVTLVGYCSEGHQHFGLAKYRPTGEMTYVSTTVMGTYGYCAPDYAKTGKLTVKADIYCFGVVLLELIGGLRAINDSHGRGGWLVNWVQPFLRDGSTMTIIADPQLRGAYPKASLTKALNWAMMCTRDDAWNRPTMTDVVRSLDYLVSEEKSMFTQIKFHIIPPCMIKY
ncbi:Tyrosine-protein kinase [Parasponia andersonii]|uniref:Tyrosine-protein kinase n=1 Tax=Parasponia andersonii TaxID=3476 RepID=A0A2P5CJM6_PARAD|nr:Tyrosine-protein kinase [Parasponia andersonii]